MTPEPVYRLAAELESFMGGRIDAGEGVDLDELETIVSRHHSGLVAENKRLKALMKQAGLECLLGADATPEKVSMHMASVRESWAKVKEAAREVQACTHHYCTLCRKHTKQLGEALGGEVQG